MSQKTQVRLVALWAMLWAVMLAGCGGAPSGPPRIHVKGRVSNKGEPLKVRAMVGRVQVTFYPVTAPGAPHSDPQEAAVKPNGDFTVPGTDGKGIVAGQYKIAVRQWEEFPNKDLLAGKFDEKNTKLIREITGRDAVVIDVSE
ncbi:MAG: hypothetical protein V4719_11070 [Planctomycetota bacterium]